MRQALRYRTIYNLRSAEVIQMVKAWAKELAAHVVDQPPTVCRVVELEK